MKDKKVKFIFSTGVIALLLFFVARSPWYALLAPLLIGYLFLVGAKLPILQGWKKVLCVFLQMAPFFAVLIITSKTAPTLRFHEWGAVLGGIFMGLMFAVPTAIQEYRSKKVRD